MVKPQWSTLVQQYSDAGLILLDDERHVIDANLKGWEYMALLAEASMGDVVFRLGDRPLPELMSIPSVPGVQVCHEIILTGPPCQIFEAMVQPVETNCRVEGWLLVVREIDEGEQPQSPAGVVYNWPPGSPMTSNRP